MAFRFGAGAASGGGGSTSPLTTKGDAWVYSNADTRLAVGTDGKFLMADSAATEGVSYQTISEGRISTSDITTLNVTSTKHGLAPKSGADATTFLNGAATPAYAQVKDSDLATTNITTNNVTTSKHGFAPILPNDATKYLDGTGAYTVPAGSGGGWGLSGNTLGADKTLGGLDNFAVKMFANNVELMRMVDDGANLQWTGPRLKIGHTDAAFYPNGDIVSINKNLGDQLLVTIQNPHNNVAHPSACGFTCINNDGTKTGGIGIFNDDWGSADGVVAGDYACIAFGGPAVYGTQTTQDVRFIANNTQWAFFDQSAGEFIIDGASVRVTNGIVRVTNAGAILTIGNAGDPAAAGGIKAGVSGSHSLTYNAGHLTAAVVGGESLAWDGALAIQGKSSADTALTILSGASAGANHVTYLSLQNADGKWCPITLPETGYANSYYSKASFLTHSTPAGIGWRVNVNATDNSGISIGTGGGVTLFGSLAFFGGTPHAQDNLGATLTNNVTSGGTTDQIDDFTSLTVYATDAAAIRNDIYQLARKVTLIMTMLKDYSLIT